MGNLSLKAKAYIFFIITAGLILLPLTATHIHPSQLGMIVGLTVLGSVSLLYKVIGSTDRSHYNISFLIYAFALVNVGVEGTIVVIVISNLVEWAVHKYAWYIQVFNITSFIIAIVLAGNALHLFDPVVELSSLWAVPAVLAAILIFNLANHLMIGIVLFLARDENFIKSGVFDWFPLALDFSLLSMGGVLAFIWAVNPLAVILGLVPLYLIYSTLRVPALERKTNLDAKTGLFNAEYFRHELEEELARAERYNRPLTVVLGDLDLLRNINNTYGHLAGDVALKGIADILKSSVRAYDIVSRFGGEEFAILMPETTPDEAHEVSERLRTLIEANRFVITTSVTPIQVTMSFGVAGRIEGRQLGANEIIHNADVALYHAKLSGRNQVILYVETGLNPFHLAQGSGEEPAPIQEVPPAVFQPPAAVGAAVPPAAEAKTVPAKPTAPQGKPQWVVNGFIGLLLFISAAIFALTFDPAQPIDWVSLGCYGAMVALTEWLSIEIYVRDTSISTSIVPILAGTLLLGPVGAVTLGAVFAIVTMIKHHSPLNRFFFNVSNQLIACLALLLFFRWIGFDFLRAALPLQIIVGMLAGGYVFLSTTLLLSMIIDLNMGESFIQIWKERFSWLGFSYLALGLVAVVLLFSSVRLGFLGMLAILLPMFLLRYSQVQFLDRTEKVVVELHNKNNALEASSTEINNLNTELLDALVEAIDLRDPYVVGHSRQVARYAKLIAAQMGFTAAQVARIHKAGLLHDIGKLGIPEAILFKPGRLNADEYAVMKNHAALGAEILKTSHALQEFIPIIVHHHEYYNGKGYPSGLSGETIPLEARIIALSDAVEAMASDRPYRKGLSMTEILTELERCSGTQFDPQVVRALFAVIKQQDEVVINSAKEVIQRAELVIAPQ
jgi:diguanylate cyclase (GGDEF)-like protein/putative nucleotidyltransferase with HDIG domain